MAFRLTRDQKVRLRDLGDQIAKEKAELDAVSADALGKIEVEIERLLGAHQTYADVVVAAGGEVEGWADELEAEWDDKSERWQEGERGQAVREWIEEIRSIGNEMSNIDAPDISFDPPDDADDYSERLGDIAEEPGL